MPTYDPKKPPSKYPVVFVTAFEKALAGAVGQEFRTTLREFEPGVRKLRISQMMAGFKASLRRHPAHPLAKDIDKVQTRIEWEGDTAVVVSWKVFRPASLLEGLL